MSHLFVQMYKTCTSALCYFHQPAETGPTCADVNTARLLHARPCPP